MNANEPAFPSEDDDLNRKTGMDLRAYVATKVMAAIISRSLRPNDCNNKSVNWADTSLPPQRMTAKLAVEYADCLIAELSKP